MVLKLCCRSTRNTGYRIFMYLHNFQLLSFLEDKFSTQFKTLTKYKVIWYARKTWHKPNNQIRREKEIFISYHKILVSNGEKNDSLEMIDIQANAIFRHVSNINMLQLFFHVPLLNVMVSTKSFMNVFLSLLSVVFVCKTSKLRPSSLLLMTELCLNKNICRIIGI